MRDQPPSSTLMTKRKSWENMESILKIHLKEVQTMTLFALLEVKQNTSLIKVLPNELELGSFLNCAIRRDVTI